MNFSNIPQSITELRAERERNAALWTPRDVLISMLREIDSGKLDPTDIVCVYQTSEEINYQQSTQSEVIKRGLAAIALDLVTKG